MADILLTDKDDNYTVLKGAQWATIRALAGNDTIILQAGSNVLGGPGNDTIIDQTGGNYCSALYWDSPNAIDVNLQTGVAQDGWGTTDTLVNIHNVNTSGRDGDRVIGSSQDDNVWVNGFWMSGKATIDLGAGYDVVSLGNARSDYVIQISVDGRSITIARNNYTVSLFNVESIQFYNNNDWQRYTVADLIDFSKVGAGTLIQAPSDAWSSNAKGVNLSYSFMSAVPSYGGADGGTSPAVPSAAYQAAVRSILAHLSQDTGLTFTEVADTSTNFGQLRFGTNQQTSTKGYSFSAAAANGQKAGDVWMDVDSVAVLTEGSEGWQALLHEIGHALGLSHPLATSDTSGKTVLLDCWNNNAYTVMSETQSPSALWQSWYGPLDLQALRSLYGTGISAAHPGNDTYALTDAQGLQLSTLSDTSGHDTLDLSKLTQGAYVDLKPGTFSSVGVSPKGGAALGNLYIDGVTVIEDLVGTAYDDVLTGNSADNTISPGTGNDMVDGAGGFNIVKMSATRAAYTLSKDTATGHVLMQSVDGASGADELQNIQRIAFSDCAVALDMDVKGSTVAKVLGAVFGKDAITNRGFAGIGMSFMDQGYTPERLMDLALNFKLGQGFNAASEVNLLFGTLIGRAPSSDELSYYTGLVSKGQFSLNGLAWMAANTSFNTDNIGLTGLMQTGLDYAPLGSSLV
jgi:serralysin